MEMAISLLRVATMTTQKAMKQAFECFVNKDVGKYTNAEMMSTFCDRILKTGGEKMSDDVIEKRLDAVVQLFSYLEDKDVASMLYDKCAAGPYWPYYRVY